MPSQRPTSTIGPLESARTAEEPSDNMNLPTQPSDQTNYRYRIVFWSPFINFTLTIYISQTQCGTNLQRQSIDRRETRRVRKTVFTQRIH